MNYRVIGSGLIACGVFLMLTGDASALPVFARKYRTSCTTCHIGFNKLNSFGESFRQNGYVIPGGGEAMLVKEEPVSLGAEAWKRVWPEAVWPGAIPSNVPIAFLVHQRVNVEENDQVATTNFQFPHEFEFMVGGNMGEALSFFGKYILDEDGQTGSGTLDQMFFRFNDVLAEHGWGGFGWLPDDAANLKVGRFLPAFNPWVDNTRRTLSHYLPYDYTVGSSTWNMRDIQSGLELSGILAQRFLYGAGIVNGDTGSSKRVEDLNDEKDFYYRVAYKLGGQPLTGPQIGEELIQTDNWVDNAVTIGQFGYWGRNASVNAVADENNFYRVGVDGRMSFGDLDLYGLLMLGRDDKPSSSLATANRDLDTIAWFAEADYVVFPWLIGALRYEGVNFDGTTQDKDQIVTNLAAWVRANVRLMLEGTLPFDNEDGNKKLVLDLTYLF